MFKRRLRLSKDEITMVSKGGMSIHTPLFSIKTLPFTQKPLEIEPCPPLAKPAGDGRRAKFAFVMSKKEEKTAVGRNKAKRRLRAAFRKFLPALKPLYYMVFIKKATLSTAFPQLCDTLKDALTKNSYIKG